MNPMTAKQISDLNLMNSQSFAAELGKRLDIAQPKLGAPINAVKAKATLSINGVVTHGETITIDNPAVTGTDTYEFLATADQVVSKTGNKAVNINTSTTKATVTLTVDTQPVAAQTMTIGTKLYTFVAVGADNADGKISVGADLAAAKVNIVAAINGSGFNQAHPQVTAAAFSGNTCLITAKVGGTIGNYIVSTETMTGGNNAFSSAKLVGGTDCSAENAVTALVASVVLSDTQNVNAINGAENTVVFDVDTAGVSGNSVVITENLTNGEVTSFSGGINGTLGFMGEIRVVSSGIYIASADNTITGSNWKFIPITKNDVYVYSSDIGLIGDGLTNNSTRLISWFAELNGVYTTLVVSPGSYLLDSDITFPSNVSITILYGAYFKRGVGVSITMSNNKFEAGTWKCFELGTDVVSIGTLDVTIAYPEWFGALGDGSTDDTLPLQIAINTFAGKCPVFISSKTYVVDSLKLKQDLTLKGEGRLSKLLQKTSAQYAVTINKEGFTSDVNNNMKNVLLEGLHLEGTVATQGFSEYYHLLIAFAVTDLTIDRCYFTGWRGDAICLRGENASVETECHNKNIIIKNCKFDGINNDNRQAISVLDVDTIHIDNNEFKNCTRSNMPGAIDFEPNNFVFPILKHIKVSNNRFYNVGGGIGVITIYVQKTQLELTTPIDDIVIEGNLIDGAIHTTSGIYFKQGSTNITRSSPNVNLIIRHNSIQNIIGKPLYIQFCNNCRVHNNRFINADGFITFGYAATNNIDVKFNDNYCKLLGKTGGMGLRFGEIEDLDVEGNTFIDFSKGTAGENYFIDFGVTSESKFVSIKNNRFISTRGTAFWAIQKEATHNFNPSGNRFEGNTLNGMSSAFKAYATTVNYGFDNSGRTSINTALTSVLSTLGSTNRGIVLFPAGSYLLDANITISTNVTIKMELGAKFIGAVGSETFTMYGVIEAGTYPIFENIIVTGNPKNDEIYAEWFGAKGDNINDDTVAINKAITAFSRVTLINKYKTTTAISLLTDDLLNGKSLSSEINCSENITIIDMTNAIRCTIRDINIKVPISSTATVIKLNGTVSQVKENYIKDIRITAEGFSSFIGLHLTSSLEAAGVYNNQFSNIFMRYPGIGILIDTYATNGWVTNNQFTQIGMQGFKTYGIKMDKGTGLQISNMTFSNIVLNDSNTTEATRYGVDLAGFGHSFHGLTGFNDGSTGTFKMVTGYSPSTIIDFASAEGAWTINDLLKFQSRGQVMWNKSPAGVVGLQSVRQSGQNLFMDPMFKMGTKDWNMNNGMTVTQTADDTVSTGNKLVLTKNSASRANFYYNLKNPKAYRGKVLTFVAEVKTSNLSASLLYITDSTNTSTGGAHSGNGERTLLSVSKLISDTTTSVLLAITLDGVDTNTSDVFWVGCMVGSECPMTPFGEIEERNKNIGTFTLGSAETSKTIPHGLSRTPSPADITIVPTSNLGTTAKWYITTTSTNIVITFNAAPGSDVSFAWKANYC